MPAWSIAKWVVGAILLGYVAIQIGAVRRLQGNRKRRSVSILYAMVVLEGLSVSIGSATGSRDVSRIGMIVVGAAAVAASMVLIQMLRAGQDAGAHELKGGFGG
jgi:hypothetical protein